MTTTGSAGISFRKNELIRKALTGGVFIAPYSSDAISLDNLFDPTTGALLNPLPDGYRDLGYLSTAGAVFARAIKTTDIDSWQSDNATRTDITSDVTSLTIEPQETNQGTVGLYLGLSTPPTPGANGAFSVTRPSVSTPTYWRVLALAVDTVETGEVVYARFLPRALVTAFASQTLANGSDPIEFGVTITAYLDSVLGTPEIYLFGGEGQQSLQVDMGFDRSVTCTTTSADTTLTATSGNFFANDVGAVVTGTGIPDGTTIASVTSATVAVMSAAASASGSDTAVTIAGEA